MQPKYNLLTRPVLNNNADKWLEEHIYLPRETSPNAPGRLSLARQPWARDILNICLDPSTEHVNFVMGAQTGKTTLLLLLWLALSHFAPLDSLIALSTDPLADRLVKRRLLPLIKANPLWGDKLPPLNRGQESMILFPGMNTFYTGARTPSKLASYPAAYLFLDEVSKWESGTKRESHPYMLVKERVKSFASHKIFSASTPSDTEDIFWAEYLHSSQSHYEMPCIHCGKYIRFDFEAGSIHWEGGKLDLIRKSAHYVCKHCHGKIYDNDKAAMMENGRWVADKPDHAPGHIGFHLNSLYSPFVSFGDFACEFIKCNNSALKKAAFQNFTNSWLALPWEDMVKRTTKEEILQLVDVRHARGRVPEDYVYLVAGVDPGIEETHWSVCAVMPDGVLYLVDYGRQKEYSSYGGKYGIMRLMNDLSFDGRPVDICYIDSGYNAKEVYAECLNCGIEGFMNPCKGVTSYVKPYSKHDIYNGEVKLSLHTYADYNLKSALEDAKKEKRLILPGDTTQELFDGISGQTKIKEKNGRLRWKQLAADHYNDCIKLCLLSSWFNLGVDVGYMPEGN